MSIARWWDTKYPFRRQLLLQNIDQTLAVGDNFSLVIPQEWIDQGKINEDNFAVVYNDRQIAKPVGSSLAEPDGVPTVVGTIMNPVEPHETVDSYFLYYGAADDDVVAQPTLGTGNTNILLDPVMFSYTKPEDWLWLSNSGVDPTHPGIHTTTVLGSKFTVTSSFAFLVVLFMYSDSFNGQAKIQVDDGEPEFLSLRPPAETDDLGFDIHQVAFQYSGEIDDQIHTITIENISGDLVDQTVYEPVEVFGIDGDDVGSDVIDFFTDTESATGLAVSRVVLSKWAVMEPLQEEVTDSLPWNSKMGGVINVG